MVKKEDSKSISELTPETALYPKVWSVWKDGKLFYRAAKATDPADCKQVGFFSQFEGLEIRREVDGKVDVFRKVGEKWIRQ